MGCGDGLLARLLVDIGHDVSVVEINKDLHPEIRKNCGNNVKIYSSINEVKETFNVITCLQVIEHIPEQPIVMIKKIDSLLNQNGMFILTTPIETCLQDVEHKWYFNFYDIQALGNSISSVFEIYFIDKFERNGNTTNCFGLVAQKL